MKDVAGENVETVVSYLKGVLLLLNNCFTIPTDVMELLNDVMVSADCAEFVNYMKSIYFVAKNNSLDNGYMECLDIAEAEYRIMYRRGKLAKAIDTSEASFISDTDEIDRRGNHSGGQGRRGGRDGDRRRGGRDGPTRKHCHTYGKIGHLART